jgi:UDP-N-acetylmuramoyl-tripeptide--D-alanyl-D-alanine ligase
LELTPDTEFGVFEVGMNHPGEIEPLARMISPDIAIITQIAEAHIGHMGSLEGIAFEKRTLINALKPNGNVLLYGGGPCDSILLEKAATCKHQLFDMTTVNAHVVDCVTRINTTIGETPISYTLPFSGLHHVGNSILALEACSIFGIDVAKAAKILETFTLPDGRGAIQNLSLPNGISIKLIDDAYNANPVSMCGGLASFKALPKTGRRIAVLGEMLELGEKTTDYHRALLTPIKDADIDLVFCTGDAMRHLFDVLPESIKGYYTLRADELIEPVVASLAENDLIFIKGSKGSKVSLVVDHLVNVAATC